MSELQYISKDALLTEHQRQEIKSARKELAQALDEMLIAIQSNQTIRSTADALGGKGWWSAFKGTVSGTNDRDLASMIKGLSGSLETTQVAVQLILRLQNRKDHVLREFHSILIEKIQKIQADTHTLDANQQSAVDVLYDFQEQIEDQLRRYEAVDRHEQRITELIQKYFEIQQDQQILSDQTAKLQSTEVHLTAEIDSIRKNLNAHYASSTQLLSALAADIASTKEKSAQDLAALQSAGLFLMELIEALKKQHTSDHEALAIKLKELSEAEAILVNRMAALETQSAKQASVTGWLKANAVAVIGLAIGGTSFAHNIFHW